MGNTRHDSTGWVSALASGEAARRFLAAPSVKPGLLRAVAGRADELRFLQPCQAVAVAEAALEALPRMETTPRRASLAAFAWAVYGTTCRHVDRFEAAELAFNIAARLVPRSDTRTRTGIARRLAYLRADQRRGTEARRLIDYVVKHRSTEGNLPRAQAQVDRSAILIHLSEYAEAATDIEQALEHLPASGGRYYLSAVFNLARCRLELSSSPAQLEEAVTLAAEAARFVEPSSHPEIRLRWLIGNLLCRQDRLEDGLAALTSAYSDLEEQGHGFDRALLTLDLAELHLKRGEPECARNLAYSSFGILSALRADPEAFRAMKVLYKAALELSLDLTTVRAARASLLASRS